MNIDFVYEDEKHLCQESYEDVFKQIIETTLKTYSHLYPNKQNELAEKLQQLHQNI